MTMTPLFSVADTDAELFRGYCNALAGEVEKIFAEGAYTGEDAALGIKCNALDLTLQPHDSSLRIDPVVLRFSPNIPCIVAGHDTAPDRRLPACDAASQKAALTEALATLRLASSWAGGIHVSVWCDAFSLEVSYSRRGTFVEDIRLCPAISSRETAGALFAHVQECGILTQLDRIAAACFKS